jgi:glycosyltransferase involved in cell wall biosynthesis
MRILYDGWSLLHNPISPESLHLQAVLANLPDEITPLVALPGPAPKWIGDLEVRIHPMPDTPFGRLRWQQVQLSWLAKKLKIKVLHLTLPTAPVLSSQATLLSPCSFGAGIGGYSGIRHTSTESNQILTRLRQSLAQGGIAQVKEILWPLDLPANGLSGTLARLPPIIPAGFIPADDGHLPGPGEGTLSAADLSEQVDLPETFIIYHGPGDWHSLEHLVQAWTWAVSAIGENYPLLVLGLDRDASAVLSALLEHNNLGNSLRVVPDVRPDLLAYLYQRCSAVFHPAPASPWAGPVRLALACGKPLVASENSITDAIVGPAAYLAPPGDPRALGAALVTVVVEEQVAENLSAAAARRAKNWGSQSFSQQLLGIYRRVLPERGRSINQG